MDLSVRKGEFFTLLGPSGCGKTTLLRIIAGLEETSTGKVFIGEREVTNVPPAKRDIAMVFQNYALYPHMTVRENISTGQYVRTSAQWWQGAVWLGAAKREEMEVRSRVEDIIEFLEIEGLDQVDGIANLGGRRGGWFMDTEGNMLAQAVTGTANGARISVRTPAATAARSCTSASTVSMAASTAVWAVSRSLI